MITVFTSAVPVTLEFTNTPQGISGTWHLWFNGSSQTVQLEELKLDHTVLSFKLKLPTGASQWGGRYTPQ